MNLAIEFEAGEVIYTYGLDMECRTCVVKTKFVRVSDDGRIVTESDGVKVISKFDRSDYFKTYEDCLEAINNHCMHCRYKGELIKLNYNQECPDCGLKGGKGY